MEFKFWTDNRMVTFSKDGKSYTMARYYAPSRGPRPESYKFVFCLNNIIIINKTVTIPILMLFIGKIMSSVNSVLPKKKNMISILGSRVQQNLEWTFQVDGLRLQML